MLHKMITSKDIESYIIIKEFMEKNDIKEIDSIIKMIGLKVVHLIIETENGESKKCYSLKSASKFAGVSIATMYYAYNNHRSRINRRKGGDKTFCIR